MEEVDSGAPIGHCDVVNLEVPQRGAEVAHHADRRSVEVGEAVSLRSLEGPAVREVEKDLLEGLVRSGVARVNDLWIQRHRDGLPAGRSESTAGTQELFALIDSELDHRMAPWAFATLSSATDERSSRVRRTICVTENIE